MVGSVSQTDTKYLFALSGGMCAKCKELVIREGDSGKKVLIAEICHIRGKRPRALRHDPEYSTSKISSRENLIVLCSNCHTEIDKNEEDYSVESIIRLKMEHEEYVLKKGLSEPVLATEIEYETMSVVAMREPPETMTTEKEGVQYELKRWSIIDDHMDSKSFVVEMKNRAESRFDAICETASASYDSVLYRHDRYHQRLVAA
ncbi:MAG: hypothetical protein P1Q69_20580, partial [Candidatus Thorarchaeota archaeon]|nr:hypothetical protein [Candidatus Thorarchaeota archaeon]